MSDFLAGWRFALRRLRAGWRFMLVSALGVVVAATLLAITPIYSTAMSDLGLSYRLTRELPEVQDRLAYREVSGLRFGNAQHAHAIDVIDTVTEARVGWLGDGALSESRSNRFDVSFRDHLPPDAPVEVPADSTAPVRQDWGGYLFHLGGWEEHVDLVEGRLPGLGPTAEAVLPEGFRLHAAVGDVLRLTISSLNDCPNVPPSENPQDAEEEIACQPSLRMRTFVDVEIVGFVRPHDATAERWVLFEGEWETPSAPILPRLQGVGPNDLRRVDVARGIGQMPVLTTAQQFHEVFREHMPEATIRHRVGVVADTSRLGLGEVALAVDDLSQWNRDIGERLDLSGFSKIDLLNTLQGFQTAQSFTAVPLLVVLLQVVGIVIYYVVMVMAMLLERQKQEVGVFRSRGATTSQLVGFSLVEGLAFIIPALLLSPWLAAGVVSLLGYTPTFEAITGGSRLPVTISPEAYLFAVLGGVLSLLAILFPAYLSVRRGIVDVKREESRPAERNFLQRYLLDFALVGLAALLLWQLDRQGSVFDPGAVGGWGSDPLLLAAPFALTASVALMMLRFYPPLVRLAVRVLLLLQGTAAAIGLRRAGRAPASYARVVLLLIMAVAVGTFAASYGPTVDQSLEDRARYTAAIDMRGQLDNPADREMGAHLASLSELERVADVSTAYRGGILTSDGLRASLLGIDPNAIVDAIWWRDDFAELPLVDLLASLAGDVSPVGGYVLPEDAVRLEMQINTTQPGRLSPRARFRQEDGRYMEAYMRSPEGEAEGGEWVTWAADVPSFGGPFRLGGLLVDDNRTGGVLREEGRTLFDELAVIRADGTRVLLDDFEGPQRWMMLNARDTREEFMLTTEDAASGQQALMWTWVALVQPQTRAFAPAMPAVPLTAIMDTAALGSFRTEVGGLGFAELEGIALPVHVRAQTDLFPSLDPANGMVIVNFEHLREVASFLGFAPYAAANEVWVEFEPGTPASEQQALVAMLDEDGVGPRIDQDWVVQAVDVEGATADPTLQAAGSGILAVAFVAVIGLCTVGFVATMALGARQRATEFAVLRAVGVSRVEVLRALILEWGVVLVVGVAVGALLGRQVAQVMLGFLNVTETGAVVVPPFVLQTSWQMLGAGLGALTGAVAVSLFVAWLIAMRRSPTVELRLTQ